MTIADQKYLSIYKRERKKIENKLSKLLTGFEPASLYEPCAYIIQSSGKRIRPFLVLISTYAVGGKFSQAYNASIAVELLHNFTLVHDDIMDNADKRRGMATLHIKYDTSTAILAGDNLIALAYQYLLRDCKDNDKQVLGTFTRGIIEVCEGQSLDKEFENKSNVSLKQYKLMIQKKTAALAEMCCSIGAQIGGGSNEEVKSLADYGKNLGMAFQVQDDLLDIIGDELKFGKTVGSDLLEGKKTFLFLQALEKARGQDKILLQKMIKNKGIKKTQIQKYKNVYERLGVIEAAKREIKRYTDRSVNSIKKLKSGEARNILLWLANALTRRSK